ncbi:MAG: hypothetical protein WC613_02380 [Candidatus Aenigmatarchaeota archaeon]
MTVYDKTLEKAKVDAKKAFARLKAIEKMKSRAEGLSRISDIYLRIRDNQDCLDADPVYVMVTRTYDDIWPYTRIGHRTILSLPDGRDKGDELHAHAVALSGDMWNRTMTEATYNALSDGTHLLYQQARALGIEIKPGQKPQEIL